MPVVIDPAMKLKTLSANKTDRPPSFGYGAALK